MKNFQTISLVFFINLILIGQQGISASTPAHQTAEIQQVAAHADEAHYPSSRGLLNSIHSQAESSIPSFQKLAEMHSVNELDEEEKFLSKNRTKSDWDKRECYLEQSTCLFIGYSIRQIIFPFHSFL